MNDTPTPYMLTQMVGGAPGPGSALVDLREVVIVEPISTAMVHWAETGHPEARRRRWYFLIHLRGIPTPLTCFAEPVLSGDSKTCDIPGCERLTAELRAIFSARILELRA